MNARLSGVHIEACGTASGGQFIDWNPSNGTLSVQNSSYSSYASGSTYAINLDSSFGGSAYIGPGNIYGGPSVYNTNGSTAGNVVLYDPLGSVGGSIPAYLGGFGFFNNSFAYPTYTFRQELRAQQCGTLFCRVDCKLSIYR